MIGTSVGSYRIVSKLSIGGMGTVYRAEHALIGKLAAVKVLHPELSTSRDIVNRFFNEAKATTTIKHPGIVEVFDFGYMESGHAYLTMEYLEGMSLARRCKTRGPMTEGEAAMLLRAVCSALSAAHAKGIVHRDLKPDNIFLVTDPDTALGERPKILDFGIAKLTDIGMAGTATKTGAVMGTPTYMSPEQCKGTGVVDHRADLYSLGCILYELITGRPPFTELGAGELIGAHLYVAPQPPTVHTPVSPSMTKLIMALLDKDPAQRPQTAKELGHRLETIAQQQGWITHTSPAGITAPSYAQLPSVSHAPTMVSTPLPRAASTPSGVDVTIPSRPPAPTGPTPTDKPTTLLGAASSIIEVPTRSRRKLGLAMLTAALLAGGTVAFVSLRGSREPRAATGPATYVAPTATTAPATGATPSPPITDGTRPSPSPPQVPPPPQVQPATTPEVPTPTVPTHQLATPSAPTKPTKPTKPTTRPTSKLTKKPAATTTTPTTPVKPKQPSLIETDL